MAQPLTYPERKRRAEKALGEMQTIVDQITTNTPGRERGRLLRLAQGRNAAVRTALGRVAAGQFGRGNYTDAQRREAGQILERAAKLYTHARRFS